MELNTGLAVTIMAEFKFKEILSDSLQESAVNLCTYSGEKIQVKGEAMCNVEYEGKHYVLPIVVISRNGPTFRDEPILLFSYLFFFPAILLFSTYFSEYFA